MKTIDEAYSHLVNELISDVITDKLSKLRQSYVWLEDASQSFFELIGDIYSCMNNIECICSKLYTDGLIFILMYFEGIFYAVVQESNCEEPLLDIEFPDVGNEGEGLILALYDEPTEKKNVVWRKLSIWESRKDYGSDTAISPQKVPSELINKDFSSSSYQHTYCVLNSDSIHVSNENESAIKNVIFRFGSWFYSGKVELIPNLSIQDIQHVPPAIRIQQKMLTFLCEAKEVPSNNTFSNAMEYFSKVHNMMKNEVSFSESIIANLSFNLEQMGLTGSARNWLHGNPKQTFFEFSIAKDDKFESMFKDINVIATKCYEGEIITTSTYFEGTFYFALNMMDGEHKLLDSEFPSITQGRGYLLKSYKHGLDEWPILRKMTIWQNAETVDAELQTALEKVSYE